MSTKLTLKRFWQTLLMLALLTPILTGCAIFAAESEAPAVELDEYQAAGDQQAAQEGRAADDAPAEEAVAGSRDESVDNGVLVEAEEAEMERAAEPAPESGFADADAAEAGGMGGGGAGGEVASAPLPTMAAPPVAEAVEGDRGGGDAFAADAEIVPRGSEPVVIPQQVVPLQAGEIDDNAEWDDYLLYRREFLTDGFYPVHDVDVTGRHIINVRTTDDFPVLSARVRIYSGQALVSDTRTYATGQTLFFPNANPRFADEESFEVTVEKGDAIAEFTLNVNEINEWHVVLGQIAPTQERVNLDVLFLIDATGSMADEIEQLQSNILSISAQIDALPSRPNTRYGMVTYRDRGDEYVTRVYDFTPDVGEFQNDLNRVRASGGGDTPESLNEALYDAVHRPEWRVDNTVSLVFLVADAAPHLDYGNDADYAEEMAEAARLGIKIHPIASSGLDPQGEFIFRQIGQYTMGHFIFLTYEGEQGGFDRPDLEAGGQDYSVGALDELVLRLIEDELDALSRR
jgi:hypothetical protein